MEHKEYRRLAEREHFFWWNVGRRRILRDALARHTQSRDLGILDVGCGPGGNILFLSEFGRVTGLDASDEALSFTRERGFSDVVKSAGESLPFDERTFDVVSALDVIEHIEDDSRALSEMARVLKDDGILLVTVPAYRWMWSSHDKALHHKRRYEYKDLRRKIIGAGLVIKEMSYFVIPSIPFRALKLCVDKLKKLFSKNSEGKNEVLKTDDVILPSFLNALLVAWLGVERLTMRFAPIPFGSSLLVVAAKKKD